MDGGGKNGSDIPHCGASGYRGMETGSGSCLPGGPKGLGSFVASSWEGFQDGAGSRRLYSPLPKAVAGAVVLLLAVCTLDFHKMLILHKGFSC
jgi:hypothetical protein